MYTRPWGVGPSPARVWNRPQPGQTRRRHQENLTQYELNTTKENPQTDASGAPQGSVLGPDSCFRDLDFNNMLDGFDDENHRFETKYEYH